MNGWIGIDLDCTLAEYHGWPDDGGVGKPIPKMVERVKQMLSEGRRVKIFTARVGPHPTDTQESRARQLGIIQRWCLEHLGVVLEVTCTKDYGMVELWDDRCVQVVPNTGETLAESIRAQRVP